MFIDLSLELSLVRRLKRHLLSSKREEDPVGLLEYLDSVFHHYIVLDRRIYLEVAPQVKNNCDLIVDGMKSIEEISKEIVERVLEITK